MAGKNKTAKRGGRKALARKISRKRALSYDRMAPNKRGVTAMSEINGRGAYDANYERTRRLLANKEEARMASAKSWKGKLYRQQLEAGRTPAQARATVRMVEGAHEKKRSGKRHRKNPSAIEYGRPQPKKARSTRSRIRSRTPSTRARSRKPQTRTRKPQTRAYRPNLKSAGKRKSKSDFIREQKRKGASPKQAEARWKLASGYYGKKKKTSRKKARTYGKGKYTALKAHVGDKSRQTYFYRTKKGNIRKIPDHALLGYASAREMNEVYRSGTDAQRARLAKRLQSLHDRREKAAERAARRARSGSAWFSPNPAGEQILEFEEWQMKRNAARKTSKRRSTKKKTKSTSKSRSAAAKKAAATRKRNKAKRSAAAKKAAATRKRRASSRKSTRKKTTRRKTARKKSSAKRKTRRSSKKRGFAAMSKAKRCRIARKGGQANARKTRKKKRTPCSTVSRKRTYKRNAAGAKKRSTSLVKRTASGTRKKSKSKRSYKRNVRGAAYKQELKNALKYGAIVTGGYLTHRVLSNLADKYVLSKVEALSTGSMAPYRKLIGSTIVAAIGIPAAVRLLPKHAGVAAAGMAASLLHGLIVTALSKAEQPELLEAVSAYPNAQGYPQYSGYGSYYEFSPHQVFDGYGQDYVTQAAAGYGNLQQMYANRGGYGEFYETQPVPGLEQAAAGMGEYYAFGAEGIGEYESAPAAAGPGGYTDDGIHPNLNAAEQMLDVAEAAAGLDNMVTQAAAGFGSDIPLQSTVDPMIRAMNIPDMPGGSRAGTLAGGDGIFG